MTDLHHSDQGSKPNIACDRGCGGDPSKCNCWAYRAPAVEPEQPTSVGNAASDPHLAPYCTNPDCVKIINHEGDCVVDPCEGCPDPELPCKGCPAVEPEQDDCVEYVPGMIAKPEQPTQATDPDAPGFCPPYVASSEAGAEPLDTTTCICVGRPGKRFKYPNPECQMHSKTTNLVTDYGRGYEDGQDAAQARIERIIGELSTRYHSHRVQHFIDDLFAAIRKGDDA